MKTAEKQTDKRKAIMEASLKLFCEKCFQDTSTASITSEANVGTGTLFCYFDSKEDLVNELYLESKSEFAAYVEAGVWDQPSFKTQLKHIFDKTVNWCIENPRKAKFMTQYSSSPLITTVTREKAVMKFTVVTAVVKNAVEKEELTTCSIDLISSMLSAYFHIASRYLVENADNKNFKAWKEEAFNLVWKGVH